MIIRIWLISGTALAALSWYLIVPLSPPPAQLSAASSADRYREMGLIPQLGELVYSEEIGHEVFEVPATDADHVTEEAATSGNEMPGMTMADDANDDQAGETPPTMAMGETTIGESATGSEMPGMSTPGGEMADSAEQTAPPMAMAETAEPPAEKATSGDAMPGMTMPAGEGGEHADEGMSAMAEEEGDAGGFGLEVVSRDAAESNIDRNIVIEMGEWDFTPGKLTVKAGETIRFTLRNSGNIPHEFMFMPPEGMAAVNYRLERADWNLTEHESLFEQAVVMPGDSSEVVIRIERPGQWMFMCMFPYHMQFGMMGVMMTEGTTMEGGAGMGDMKM